MSSLPAHLAAKLGKRQPGRKGKPKKKKPPTQQLAPAKRDSSTSSYESDDNEDYSNSEDEGRSGYRKGAPGSVLVCLHDLRMSCCAVFLQAGITR